MYLYITMEVFIKFIYIHIFFFAPIVLATTIVWSYFLIPKIYSFSLSHKFTDLPSIRKRHNGKVPILGGVCIYISFIISVLIFTSLSFKNFDLLFIKTTLLGLTFLLIIGLLDDILIVKPLKKLTAQILVILFFLWVYKFDGINFYGVFNVSELPELLNLGVSIFIILSFINSFNFIDGIDGLCSGISLLASVFFGYISILEKDFTMVLFNFSLIGALIPFIYFNMYSKKKIFLGDNGSLLLGFIYSIQVILLLSNKNITIPFLSNSTPVILMALFSYPLVDSLRVILIRLKRRKSPMTSDHNHIHHHLLNLGLTHKLITVLILTYTILITAVAILLRHININISFVILIVIAVIIINIPVFLVRSKKRTFS